MYLFSVLSVQCRCYNGFPSFLGLDIFTYPFQHVFFQYFPLLTFVTSTLRVLFDPFYAFSKFLHSAYELMFGSVLAATMLTTLLQKIQKGSFSPWDTEGYFLRILSLFLLKVKPTPVSTTPRFSLKSLLLICKNSWQDSKLPFSSNALFPLGAVLYFLLLLNWECGVSKIGLLVILSRCMVRDKWASGTDLALRGLSFVSPSPGDIVPLCVDLGTLPN